MHDSRWLALGACLLLAQPAAALSVTLDPGAWRSSLTDRAVDAFGADESSTSPGALPVVATTPGAALGGSSARMDYALSNAAFELGFDHTAAHEAYAGSQGSAYLYLSVDQDTPYAISGRYDLSGGSEPWRLYFAASLYDITAAPVTLFDSLQSGARTPGQGFALGQLEADGQNLLVGAASGMLLAGHVYRFYANAYVEGYPVMPRTTPGSATGSVSLVFVPEPSTLVSTGLGLIGIGARRAAGRRAGPGPGRASRRVPRRAAGTPPAAAA